MATLYIKFAAPNPLPQLGYLVRYRVNSPQGSWVDQVFPQSSGPIQFSGITSTVYDIEVYARCGVGEGVTLSLVASDITIPQSCSTYGIDNPTGTSKVFNYYPCGNTENTILNINAGTNISLCIVTDAYSAEAGLVVTAGSECVPPL